MDHMEGVFKPGSGRWVDGDFAFHDVQDTELVPHIMIREALRRGEYQG